MPQYLSPGVYVEYVPPASLPVAGVATSVAGFIGVVADNVTMPEQPGQFQKDDEGNLVLDDEGNPVPAPYERATAGEPTLITSWEEFKTRFGDFQEGNKILAHAVYGFFFNGGSRCYVLRVAAATEIDNPAEELEKFEAVDEITIVAVPGAISDIQHTAIIAHCAKMGDRVAVLDGDQTKDPSEVSGIRPVGRSQQASYAAIYYPWIKVFDPVSNAPDTLPPSGHLAGIYARNDATRGVFKAPANEVIVNALDVSRPISKAQQDGLNPEGINVIRSFKGTIKVWGARTMADDANADFRYVSTRRYFNYLQESIDDGTQFAVFEPNNLALWQRIKRTVGDFLLNEWRDGALFGETPEQAFFVKCDAETNPKEVRELGQVVALIGVAIVKPAEFVIFRIQQTAGE
ncbi:phage tail sheath subtilisin-like domain-containing protein [Moorena producens JHB]|uniref:Phage tail sheath subtilisin-like domain-containing protein n=1 Tax=Moorena producens (strain JHB) TaxID=1454205 RepID=A0A1D9FX42_MOOP1|nr:phage tail sheath subtilisin-like domain-containing protein [Moorena producens]AOY79949.1 phage tail sheath subtilisin-like domain-containing protein [Moorena producens JHB]